LKKITGIFILFMMVLQVGAQQREPNKFLQKIKSRQNKFIAIPLITYAPETRWGFGITGQYLFRFKKDSTLNPSIVGATFLYTLNKQYIVNPNWDLFFKQNKYRITGAFVYQRYPDSFFGIGNRTLENNREWFSSDYLLLKIRMVSRLPKNFFIGPQLRFEKTYNMKTDAAGIFEQQSVSGRNGYTATGAGLSLIYDTRDNVLFPFRGAYVVLSHHSYPFWLRTDYPLTNINLDARYYWNLTRSHIIALNGYANFNFGTTPFKMQAMLGGQNIMRGYFMGRYRDNFALVAQMEYRFPIWWRFIGVGFASIGDVFNDWNALSTKDMKVSGGFGLRWTVDAKERINIRFDAAWGRFHSRGFYLSLTEAF
jgi:outer membrane protein assembly factor BamA